MKQKVASALAAACLFASISPVIGGELPAGWFPAGSHPKDYDMSVDRKILRSGKASATVKSKSAEIEGFGTLMQTFAADAYRGKRVRMSGYVRAEAVSDWAGLWLRVDGPRGEVLSFDNMQDRAIKGTSDWTRHAIVLDVPEVSEQVAFGILLGGTGQVWLDDLKFEEVGKDVPTTGKPPAETAPAGPKNLGFEE